ncbi:hypothetical protein RI844_07310 [Thalassotalea fonticola]|uniref:Adhesin domain-containing protein n=1 Tax=Thalassotalea fonticola TaxID=3065649 RepID=A0ABZ0GUA0_9GAMM|nr:hypothetical protein RI844_07310 [Colwelliaceae bacterium S1-1]
MKLTQIAALLSAVLILPGCVIHVGAQSADVELEETLVIASADVNSLEIDTGSGYLNIVGVEGITEITVKADITTTKARDYELELTKVGSKAVLIAKHGSTSGFWNGNTPSIDITVQVPNNLALDIDDGSGDISITDMNNFVEVEDGSGSLFVKNIQGDLIVDDGSGELDISNVSGDVDIKDGSGEMKVVDIAGSVNVEDGSGEMILRHIGGMVTIDDGSGAIEVKDAGGLTITESGSGGLNIKGVKGEFNIDS